MAEFSSTLNEDKNINRSDPSRMYSIGQTPLAQLRPEKLDDMALKKQIAIIQEVCGDIDPDLIAVIFHECDYNIQATITRIKTGDFEDGGWQTAKSNNKKKNHSNNLNDQILNDNTQSDSERSHSQRTSPIPSTRGGGASGRERRRHDQYQYPSSSRTNTNRRGNDSNRNSYIPSNPRHSSGNNPSNTKPITDNQINSNEITSSKQNDEITPTTSSSTDEYEFIGGTTQSLTFDNSLKKTSLSPDPKRPIPSSIPQEPVSMHPTIQYSSKPIDIQFGDIQWNDSVPIPVTPSNSPISNKSLDEQDFQTTNDIDREIIETNNRLSSSSITNNPIIEDISHLSDQLANPPQQQQQQAPIQMTSSTPNTSEYTSPISQTNNPFIPNTTNPSAFTSYTTPNGPFQPIPREYSPSASNWSQQQSINYKPNTKSNIIQPGNYPQQASYQIPAQQQFIVGAYPYPTQSLYPVITSVDPWSNPGFESYSAYPTANYLPTYPTQQQYHPNTKHDQHIYDKDFFAHYGQTRLSTNELASTSQPTKDISTNSKLSATAASFSQATSPATGFYLNPVVYTVPTYYTSHPDRTLTYPSIDNRNGASYTSGNNNRNNYYQQQQRSTWHSQQ